MKIKRELLYLMLIAIVGTNYTFTDYKSNSANSISREMLFVNNLGEYYRLISIKGNYRGLLTKDEKVSFIFEAVPRNKKNRHNKTNLAAIRENIYMSESPFKKSAGSEPLGNMTSDIVRKLSGRLLFGTREM